MKETIYETVTNRIIAAIEADPGKLTMPWHRTKGKALAQPVNALTSNAYRGINTLMLWVTADMASFDTPVWATYRQWATMGAQVRGGEKSTPIIFYKEYDAAPDPSDPDDTGRRRVARASAVFNATQVDGYAPAPPAVDHGPVERYARFDALVEASGAVINRNGKQAFYMPSTDSITMPAEGLFIDTDTRTRSEAYAAVLAHELAHYADFRIMPRRCAILRTGGGTGAAMSA